MPAHITERQAVRTCDGTTHTRYEGCLLKSHIGNPTVGLHLPVPSIWVIGHWPYWGQGEGRSFIFLLVLYFLMQREFRVLWDPGCGRVTVERNSKWQSWISKCNDPLRQVFLLSILRTKKTSFLKSTASLHRPRIQN